jgi:hypothetical protein
MSGISPMRWNTMHSRARSLTSTMSHISAMLKPAPKATPSTAAMTGMSSAISSVQTRE